MIVKNAISVILSKNGWKAFSLLIVGLVLTMVTSFYVKEDAEKDAMADFNVICTELSNNLEERLHAHAELLRSGAALFAASDSVSRSDWKRFYERSYISKNLPGIQGFGFSMIIPKNKLPGHISALKNEGFPDYGINPAGDREIYTSIVYLEPFSGRNLRAFGYDMFSESRRRKAMELARDSDIAVLSDKVTLVQETQKDFQPGVLMYVPVYRNGYSINTLQQRRLAIKGWVYSPYRMNDLMKGILESGNLFRYNRIHLQLYETNGFTISLLFDSQIAEKQKFSDNLFRHVAIPVEFNSKRWIMLFMQPGEGNPYIRGKVLIVLLSGIVISLLLFFLAISFLSTSHRVRQMAVQLTKIGRAHV